MPRGKDFTTTELNEIKSFLKDGLSYEEIAELMDRTKKSILNLVSRQGWSRGRYKADATETTPWETILKAQEPELPLKGTSDIMIELEDEPEMPKPVKEKTLFDFPPREIIRHLFKELGYKIENNKLVCYVKQVVNLDDIIKNG